MADHVDWPRIESLLTCRCTTERVRRYFNQSAPAAARYTGAWFDDPRTPANSDRHRITMEDVVAIKMLSEEVPPNAVISLVNDPDTIETVGRFLEFLPLGLDFWDAPRALFEPGGPAHELDHFLRFKQSRRIAFKGIGAVISSKMIARKRPRLVPVYDQVVSTAFNPGGKRWWLPLHDTLAAHRDDAASRLTTLKHDAAVPDHVALLRVLDVAMWTSRKITLQTPPACECARCAAA